MGTSDVSNESTRSLPLLGKEKAGQWTWALELQDIRKARGSPEPALIPTGTRSAWVGVDGVAARDGLSRFEPLDLLQQQIWVASHSNQEHAESCTLQLTCTQCGPCEGTLVLTSVRIDGSTVKETRLSAPVEPVVTLEFRETSGTRTSSPAPRAPVPARKQLSGSRQCLPQALDGIFIFGALMGLGRSCGGAH